MVRFITVEREYGSQGAQFAHRLAEHLGWSLYDEHLVDEVAKRGGVSPALAQARDEKVDPWFYRVGRAFWHGSSVGAAQNLDDRLFDSARMVQLLRETMKDLAQRGKCIIVGRGASSILANVPGSFHIFVFASMPRKIRWFQQQFPSASGDLEEKLLAVDERRAEYVREFFDASWSDRHLYHLMLNSCMGFEAMIGAAVHAAGLANSVRATATQ